MGLFDDAIQEHLELRRLHGADPSEVLREEREAFGFALRVGGAEPAGYVTDFEEALTARAGHAVDGIELHTDPDLSHLSQETAELDMRAVLEAESNDDNGRLGLEALPPTMGAAPSRARVELSASGEGSTEDPLEWEIPGERKDDFGGPREKGFAPVSGVLSVRKVQAGEVLARRLDSSHAASSKERM